MALVFSDQWFVALLNQMAALLEDLGLSNVELQIAYRRGKINVFVLLPLKTFDPDYDFTSHHSDILYTVPHSRQ